MPYCALSLCFFWPFRCDTNELIIWFDLSLLKKTFSSVMYVTRAVKPLPHLESKARMLDVNELTNGIFLCIPTCLPWSCFTAFVSCVSNQVIVLSVFLTFFLESYNYQTNNCLQIIIIIVVAIVQQNLPFCLMVMLTDLCLNHRGCISVYSIGVVFHTINLFK